MVTSAGLGQTCSNSISPRWCATTVFMPAISSKAVLFRRRFLCHSVLPPPSLRQQIQKICHLQNRHVAEGFHAQQMTESAMAETTSANARHALAGLPHQVGNIFFTDTEFTGLAFPERIEIFPPLETQIALDGFLNDLVMSSLLNGGCPLDFGQEFLGECDVIRHRHACSLFYRV
jgi:hypothetical protein